MLEHSAFDPYHKWLGIPPSEQPPTRYRLLGVAAFESDPDVIEAAADQRMAHVRTYQTGKHGAISQRILNDLADARLTLLNLAKKTAYDAELRSQALPEIAAPVIAPLPFETTAPVIQRTVRPRRSSRYPAIVGGALAACVLVVGVIAMMARNRDSSPQRKDAVPSPPQRAQRPEHPPQRTVKPKTAVTPPPRSQHVPPAVVTPGEPAVDRVVLRIVQTKTETYHQDGLDVARGENGSFYVSTGGDVGEAAIGYELEGAHRLTLKASVAGTLRTYDENSFAGFILDYHTPQGYAQRVALPIGLFSDRRTSGGPAWGTQGAPGRFVDLSDTVVKELAVDEWAPANWDGRVWFTVIVQNSGAMTSIDGGLELPQTARPDADQSTLPVSP